MGKKKISDADWIKQVSEESGVTENLVKQVWLSIIKLIVKGVKVAPDKSFYIPKFGTFFVSKHKGHPLNLNIDGGNKKIADYNTFKFKPSSTFKTKVLDQVAEHDGNVDGAV